MIRNFARRLCVLPLITLSIAIVIVSIASVLQAQMAGAGQSFAKTRAADLGNPPIFLPALMYDFGAFSPISIAVADLDGDGRPDMVVGGLRAGGMINVLRGNGDGTFGPMETHGVANTPLAIVIADLNGDGKLDLVLGYGGAVGVLLGNGDGTFQAEKTFTSGGGGGGGLAVADVNGDDRLDVVVSNEHDGNGGNSTLGVLLGNGDGTLRAPMVYNSVGGGARSVAVADVNRDGKPDLVVASWCSAPCTHNSVVGVLLGNGDGTFQSAITFDSGGDDAISIWAGDVNGDGNPDVVVMSAFGVGGSGPSVVGVLLGNGDGTFQGVLAYDVGATNYRSALAVRDVNLDGNPDLLVSSGGDGEDPGIVSVLMGNGDGTFQPPDNYDSGGWGAGAIALGDLNGDQRPDLLVGNWVLHDHGFYGGMGVLLNNAGAPPTTTSLISDQNPTDRRQVITYTASVTAESGGAVTGTITFRNDTAKLATVPLSANQASYSLKYTRSGIYPTSATYSGDLQNGGSTSETLTEYVKDGTYMSLITSGSPSYLGQPVTFTATVWPRHLGIRIPDGDLVLFYDGTSLLGSVALQNQVASFTTSSLSAKKHRITAEYLGDSLFKPSHDSVGQVVEKFPTATTLTSTPNPSSFGKAVTFTAIVAASGDTLPTGTVVLWDGESAIGSAKLSGGIATFIKSKLALGTHSITARYLGDATFDRSTSPVLNQVVQ